MINTAEIRDTYLTQCGPCDYGLVEMPCNCPPGDLRPVLLSVLDELDRVTAAAHQLRRAMVDQHEAVDHALEVHAWGDDCPGCRAAADGWDGALACERWQKWQASYKAAMAVNLPAASPTPSAGQVSDAA